MGGGLKRRPFVWFGPISQRWMVMQSRWGTSVGVFHTLPDAMHFARQLAIDPYAAEQLAAEHTVEGCP